MIKAKNRGKAVLTGELDGFWLENAAHVTIEGFVFAHRGKYAIRLRGCHHVRITRNHFRLQKNTKKSWWCYIDGKNSHYNRIDHSLFTDKRDLGNCVAIEGVDKPKYEISHHDRIDHNHFRSVGQRHGENGLETIRLGWSKMYDRRAFATVEENLFEDCDGDAEVVSVKSSDNMLRNNTFVNCQGSLVLRHGDRSTVEGNFFLCTDKKTGVGGVRVIGEDHRIINNYFEALPGTGFYSPLVLMNGDTVSGTYTPGHHQVRRVLIANNTWVNCVGNTLAIGKIYKRGHLPVKDTVFANNIVAGRDSLGTEDVLVKIHNKPDHLTWRGNIIYHSKAQIGVDSDEEEIWRIDPKLTRSTDGVWRLSRDSPAIDAARGIYPEITHDFDGQERDHEHDVGADEYPTASTRRRPLTPVDVGIDAVQSAGKEKDQHSH